MEHLYRKRGSSAPREPPLATGPLEGRSQSFKGGSGPLTALIGHLNILSEYFDFFKFSLAGNN